MVKKDKCSACTEIVKDLTHHLTVRNPDQLLNQIIDPILCESVVFFHTSYSWIQESCEDLIESHSTKIKQIIKSRLVQKDSGSDLQAALTQQICGGILKCHNHEL